MPTEPSVTVIVLNWHGRADAVRCLNSLVSSSQGLSVILIDNGCQDFSPEEVSLIIPNSRYLRSPANLGFAGGYNLGLRQALDRGADYVLLLNNDAWVEPDTVTEMVRTAETDPAIGIVGAKIFQANHPERLETVGLRVDLRWGRLYQIGFGERDEGQYDGNVEPTAVSGGAMLLRTSSCKQLGGFDERYFSYLEDVDLCLRARRANFDIRLAPAAHVYHKGKSSTGGFGSPWSVYYATRNHLMLMERHGLGTRAVRALRVAAVLALNAAYALRGNHRLLAARLRAVQRGLRDYTRGVVGPGSADAPG